MVVGFINILKPPGCTSHDVVQRLRRLLQQKRIGHGGTLDPLAVGVLPVAVGKATRLLEYLQLEEKSYRAEFIVGIRTDTQDLSGRVLSRVACSEIKYEDLQEAANYFTGTIKQVPPMTSAVHFRGQRLYKLARQGLEVERPAREVNIKQFRLVRCWREEPYIRVMADITCSKGTYIRTLGADWGDFLGYGATLAFLIRSRVGNFKLEEAWTMEEIEASIDRGDRQFLLPLAAGLSHLPLINLTPKVVKPVVNGAAVKLAELAPTAAIKMGSVFRLEIDGKLVAVARVVTGAGGERLLQPQKVFR
ncbi:MAG: tRNA pseudouridine(55) synthase TruB [Clostridia bacterium]|nr:tRNA pseudouridine(55) synthase TruB [Clostridia bacterium]